MSTDDASQTYEALREKIADLNPAGADERRVLVWCGAARRLAASRGPKGELEIFFLGDPLTSDSPQVKEILSHDTWKRSDGTTITATRLVLPPTDPFDAVATFLCVELLRNGAEADPQGGLRRSEPIIETVLHRLRLQTTGVLGLVGELIVLFHLLSNHPRQIPTILNAWYGSDRSARDLQLGGVGIEIKTTTGPTSTHEVQGVRQVELGHAVGGVDEAHLFLISIGLEQAPEGAKGHSLPHLVDTILGQIRDHAGADAEALAGAFLASVKAYGSTERNGYDHNEMKDRALFSQPWTLAFCRTYDMTDVEVLVLRSSDISPRTMVEFDSVSFRIRLPDQVSGDTNPDVGLAGMLSRLTRALGGPWVA